MEPLDKIRQKVESNPVVIFMKGTPEMPQCGFSARASQALAACGEFAYVNVFDDPDIYHNLPQYANWPTFPQIYISGELIGGCDITMELYQQGELQKLVKDAVSKEA